MMCAITGLVLISLMPINQGLIISMSPWSKVPSRVHFERISGSHFTARMHVSVFTCVLVYALCVNMCILKASIADRSYDRHYCARTQ